MTVKLTMACLGLAMMVATGALAQDRWNQQTYGNQTYYNGQAGGQPFNGTSQTWGDRTDSQFNQGGQLTHCTTQRFGDQTYTNCQ